MSFLERRKFVRHPVGVPLEYKVLGSGEDVYQRITKDLSVGGISFRCPSPPPLGSRIQVMIASTFPPFETEAIVVRTAQTEEGSWEVGVTFEEGHLWFRARMVEQICHIQAWQVEQDARGRNLTFEEAAHEWIDLNAADF